MAFTNLKYGFYNYVETDEDPKVYDAQDVGMIFDGIIQDGVYMTYKNGLYVKYSELSNHVIISSGRAWFNHTWCYVDTDTPFDLSAYPISAPYKRIDAIVLDINNGTRVNSIQVVQGDQVTANPVKPTLIRESTHNQYPLAYILREGGVNTITQDKIEDARGTAACPYVLGVLEHLDVSQVVSQWETEFDSWNDAQRESFLIWRTERQEEFDLWFDAMKDQLSTDAAGHLQQEIDLMNKTVSVTATLSTTSDTIVTFTDSDITADTLLSTYTSIPDFGYNSIEFIGNGQVRVTYPPYNQAVSCKFTLHLLNL